MSISDEHDESILEKEWTIDDFDFGKQLGKGRFGRVFVARENRTQFKHLVAIKLMFKKTLEQHQTVENFKRECEYHLSLKHPNIIGFYGWFYDDRRIFFILEFAPKGNLFDKINDGPLNKELSATYLLQTVRGLIYIHSKNIIHRDLKPENLLIGMFNEIKIADFGWSNKTLDLNLLHEKDVCKSLAGTIDYLCPEIIQRKGHDRRVDIWCLGVLCYEMLVGSPPFSDDSQRKTLENILRVNYKFPNTIDKLARNLISNLLVGDPSKRMDLNDVQIHKWIDSFANKDDSYMQNYIYE